jgi:hypothetical protein
MHQRSSWHDLRWFHSVVPPPVHQYRLAQEIRSKLIKINSRRIRVAIHHSRPAPLDVPKRHRHPEPLSRLFRTILLVLSSNMLSSTIVKMMTKLPTSPVSAEIAAAKRRIRTRGLRKRLKILHSNEMMPCSLSAAPLSQFHTEKQREAYRTRATAEFDSIQCQNAYLRLI